MSRGKERFLPELDPLRTLGKVDVGESSLQCLSR